MATSPIPIIVEETPRKAARATPCVITISPPTASPTAPIATNDQLTLVLSQKDDSSIVSSVPVLSDRSLNVMHMNMQNKSSNISPSDRSKEET